MADTCQMLFDKPLDEPPLRQALVSLCAEDGISEDQIDLCFVDGAAPASWPASGSHRMNHYLPSVIGEDDSYVEYWAARGKSGKVVRLHVFNAERNCPSRTEVRFCAFCCSDIT
jgi:hypothetical protein